MNIIKAHNEEACRLIWRHSTYKMLMQVYSVEWVFKIKPNLSIIFDAMYEDLCFKLALFPCDDCMNMCIIKSEVWVISHCLRLVLKKMVCVVYLIIFLLVWCDFTSIWMIKNGIIWTLTNQSQTYYTVPNSMFLFKRVLSYIQSAEVKLYHNVFYCETLISLIQKP